VLRAVAGVLKRNLRKVDLLARYGGEEFCVLLPRIAKPEALEVAEKLRRAVAAASLPGPTQTCRCRSPSPSASPAWAPTRWTRHGLVERADAALYEANAWAAIAWPPALLGARHGWSFNSISDS